METWLDACVPPEMDDAAELSSALRGLHVVVMTTDLHHMALTAAPGSRSRSSAHSGGAIIQSRQDLIDALVASVSIPLVLTTRPRVVQGLPCFDAIRFEPGVPHLRVGAKSTKSADPAAALAMYESGRALGAERAAQGALCPDACRRDLDAPLPFSESSVWRSARALFKTSS